ncbi:hypothetical protein PFICI_09357 [Pestalotiopsis fici W106-1]|uniref:Uncharacterized protein n=1 Tax=Pestalotiopsis fici (strain W106-1 / CGMCC3.15140) TaxID=1229662 RepID=W3X0F0_PESFW|nr:uncharacterized protein PFICI_09357 [Pestalotiopsis fici W106-1]ETS79504.1 hypothetical protein PFICI_09357 [Pestalotiopsis fici W106-1]
MEPSTATTAWGTPVMMAGKSIERFEPVPMLVTNSSQVHFTMGVSASKPVTRRKASVSSDNGVAWSGLDLPKWIQRIPVATGKDQDPHNRGQNVNAELEDSGALCSLGVDVVEVCQWSNKHGCRKDQEVCRS